MRTDIGMSECGRSWDLEAKRWAGQCRRERESNATSQQPRPNTPSTQARSTLWSFSLLGPHGWFRQGYAHARARRAAPRHQQRTGGRKESPRRMKSRQCCHQQATNRRKDSRIPRKDEVKIVSVEQTTISTLPTDTEQTGSGSGWTQKKLDEWRRGAARGNEGVTACCRDNLLQSGCRLDLGDDALQMRKQSTRMPACSFSTKGGKEGDGIGSEVVHTLRRR